MQEPNRCRPSSHRPGDVRSGGAKTTKSEEGDIHSRPLLITINFKLCQSRRVWIVGYLAWLFPEQSDRTSTGDRAQVRDEM